MQIFTICLIIHSLASSLFANPIPVQVAEHTTSPQTEAPWFLSSLTAHPPESKAIDKSATGPFFYRRPTGVNIYYIGALVDIEADDLNGFAHVLEVRNNIKYPLDSQATSAAALAIGNKWGVAKGVHLYSLPIIQPGQRQRLACPDLISGLNKVLEHCKKLPPNQQLCIVAIAHFFNGDRYHDSLKETFDKLINNGIHIILRTPTVQSKQWNNPIIHVAPVDENYKPLATIHGITRCLWVTAGEIEIPPLSGSKCNIDNSSMLKVDPWLAAILRASGIVASFVYNSWRQTSRTPSPADILREIEAAAFLPYKKGGLKVLHIPPEVSGSYDPGQPMGTTAPQSPPKMPGKPVTSSQGPHLALASASQLSAGSTHGQTGLDINAHNRDASTAAPDMSPPPDRHGFRNQISDLVLPPDHSPKWKLPE